LTCRGIRGATTVDEDNPEEILQVTRELLQQMLAANTIEPHQIASILFTATRDLTSVFPAQAARELGWTKTPLICAQEMEVPGALPKCIRVLMLVNTDLPQDDIKHVYLRGAKVLRPDLQ
jgi:chorismate mutase